MLSRSWPSRFALWAAVFALLLKAGVPLFAATAAGLQGVPVAEICPVYGVSLAAAQGHHGDDAGGVHAEHAAHHHAHHAGHHQGHGGDEHKSHELAAHGDHCALTALAAAAAPDDVDWFVAPLSHAVATVTESSTNRVPDACALWVARLKHGPPAAA